MIYAYRGQGRPCREQNLLISLSKHLYLTRDDNLRYQEKPIDPRLPGTKTLLTRLVLLDVDTGTVYGELHAEWTATDIVGFLARAWHEKPHHPMHGLPARLNVAKSAMAVPEIRADLDMAREFFGVRLGDLPHGFNAGIHALRNFENAVRNLVHTYCWKFEVSQVPLVAIQANSANISRLASSTASRWWDKDWSSIPQIPDAVFANVDAVYKAHGAWRDEPFNGVFEQVELQ
ncbi:hypothetical protein [Geopseudomonas aromaticivorans]